MKRIFLMMTALLFLWASCAFATIDGMNNMGLFDDIIENSLITGSTITGSTIDSSPIGATTPSTGVFTNLECSDPTTADHVGDRAFNDARYCLESNNLSDIVDAATAYDNIKQSGTTTASGALELATDAETVTGTDTARAVTPANLTAKMAAPGAIGGTTPAAGAFTDIEADTGDIPEMSGTMIAAIDSQGLYFVEKSGTTLTHLNDDGYWEFPDGTSSVPAIGWGDTGFSHNSNAITVLTGGAARWSIASSGAIYGPGASNPSIRMYTGASNTVPVYHVNRDDTNTGLGGGADQISIIAGGAESVRIGPSGVTDVRFFPATVSGVSIYFGSGVARIYEEAGELTAYNDSDSGTPMTSHRPKILNLNTDPRAEMLHAFTSWNPTTGKRVDGDLVGMAMAIKDLWKEIYGKDAPDYSPLVMFSDIPKRDIRAERRERWKMNWKLKHPSEVEVSVEDAFETVQVPEPDTTKILQYKEKFRIKGDKVEKTYVKVHPDKMVPVKQKKANVRLDEDTGKLYATTYPTEAEAEAAADAGFTFEQPKWVRDRMK